MDTRIKQSWLDALRSGDYGQGREQLRSIPESTTYTGDETLGTPQFCCLGVLCDLYAKEHPKAGWGEGNFDPGLGDDDPWAIRADSLPSPVQEWAGLPEDDPFIPVGPGAVRQRLSSINDDGTPFAEIADLIEQHL